MSSAPERYSNPSRDVREAARRQADRLSGSGLAILGAGAALFLMVAFVVLDYVFNQDPHRILKVFLGATALSTIVMIPQFGLLVFPVTVPLLLWIPPLPVPGLNTLNILLFSVFGMYALGRVLRRQPVLRKGRLGPVLLLFVFVAALSIVRGAAFPTGFEYDARFTSIGLFRTAVGFAPYAIVLAMVRDEKQRRRVAWAVVAGLIVEATITIVLGRNGRGARATGSLGQSNDLGTYLATYSVFALALMFGTRNVFARLLLLATAAAGGFGVLLSLSRGAILSLVTGAGLVTWRGSKIVFGVLALILLASPLWAPDYVIDRVMESRLDEEDPEAAMVDGATEQRLQTWTALLNVVRDHPLDGVGFQGLGYVLPDVGTELGLESTRDSAHNTFLRMLAEMGIGGLVLFVVILWKVWKLGDEARRRLPSAFDRCMGLGLCAAVLSLAVSSAFGDRFFNVQLSSAIWMVAGLVESALMQHDEESRA